MFVFFRKLGAEIRICFRLVFRSFFEMFIERVFKTGVKQRRFARFFINKGMKNDVGGVMGNVAKRIGEKWSLRRKGPANVKGRKSASAV